MALPIQQQQQIIGRIKYLLQLKGLSQARFGTQIGVSPTNVSKHLSGKLPITSGLINRIALDLGVNRTWLLDGSETPFAKADADNARELTPAGPTGSAIPVYDIDVTAGFGELAHMFTADRIAGYINLPQLGSNPQGVRIVRVSGDSMEPMILNGGFIVVREIPSKNILWGQLYVVVLEDYRMVKIIRRHSDSSKITLHSANSAYDDIEVDRAEIIGLYHVEGILNFSQCR